GGGLAAGYADAVEGHRPRDRRRPLGRGSMPPVRQPQAGSRLRRSGANGIVTETGFERVAGQGRFRDGSALLRPTSLPAAHHPVRDLALSPVHPEAWRQGQSYSESTVSKTAA